MNNLLKRLVAKMLWPFSRCRTKMARNFDARVLAQCQAATKLPLAALENHMARVESVLAVTQAQHVEAAKESTLMVESLVREVVRLQTQMGELMEAIGSREIAESESSWDSMVLPMNAHREAA